MKPPIALLSPMANPTVEREIRRLVPKECDYVVGRLVSEEGDSIARLRSYAERLPEHLRQFGGMNLSAVAFGCTASTYLLGTSAQKEIADSLNVPIFWAAEAVRNALSEFKGSKIAVISPYPEELHQAGLNYWREADIDVTFDRRIEIGSQDTRDIYELQGSVARDAISEARKLQVEAILLSGTGMPTIDAIAPEDKIPVISSNFCLARSMLRFWSGVQ